MKILVAGGTGFIGAALIMELAAAGNEVVALVRRVPPAGTFPGTVQIALWDGATPGDWYRHMGSVNAVINLSGVSIGGRRWSASRKALILESRTASTRALVEAMRVAQLRPHVFINASAVGYYGMAGEGIVTEESGPGDDFLADTCTRWEAEALLARNLHVRVVLPRFGVVLAEGGGALEKMLSPFAMFIGGPLGSGKQWYPWIHRDDAIGILRYLLNHPDVEGGINVVSPETVDMKRFSSELGLALRRPSWLPVPSFVLKILLGEMSGMVLKGRRIVPARLMSMGYSFKHPALRGALTSILR
jgi:uncharacterized protein (TIGR01777 family)